MGNNVQKTSQSDNIDSEFEKAYSETPKSAPPRVVHNSTPTPAASVDVAASSTVNVTSPAEISKPAAQNEGVPLKQKTVLVHSGKSSQKSGDGKKGESSAGSFKPKVTLPYYMEPTYFIGGGNGVALVEDVMNDLGWKRIKEKNDDSYKLKWVELKGTINYYTFKEGDQLVNHIPNCNLLTNKLGLVNSLQDYDRMAMHYRRKAAKLDFLPETFKLDDPRDREAFRNAYKEGDMYICKPTGRNQGKGIFLVKTPEEVKKVFEEQEEKTLEGKPVKPLNRIMQRYLHCPLLLNKKKFDIRAYMLVGSTVPFFVLYHKGYVRLSIQDYDNDSDSLIAHLTNQFIQKKDPSYKDVKDDTTWSMDRLNDYVNENIFPEKDIEKDWVYNTLESRMKQIMTYCFTAVKHKLACKIGYFDLYGFDFMVDDDMKVWLIEVNVNPSLATNCTALKEVIPKVVSETIHVALECFEKSRKGKPLMPVQSIKNFQVLVNACPRSGSTATKKDPSRSKSMSPNGVRRSVTYSPTKEPTVVTMSVDVSKSVGNPSKVTPYGYVNGRGTGVSFRQVKNAPRATPTVIAGASVNSNQRPTLMNSNTNQSSSAKSGMTTNHNLESQSSKVVTTTVASGEKPPNGGDQQAKPASSGSVTTGPQTVKSPNTQSTNQKNGAQQTRSSNAPTVKEQTSSHPNIKVSSSNPKIIGTAKPTSDFKAKAATHRYPIRKETNASYKVIVKETKLPAETQIVIVDNKSKTEIIEEPRKKSAKARKIPADQTESEKRHSSVRESSPMNKLDGAKSQLQQIASDNQSVRNKWSSDLHPEERSSSKQTSSSSETRKSPLSQNEPKKSKTPVSGRKSARTTDTKDIETTGIIQSDTDRTYESKKINVHYTGHGTTTGSISSESITPLDASQPVSMKYATVFPISPYTEPVAQFKMTHRSKKTKPKTTDDKSFRGS